MRKTPGHGESGQPGFLRGCVVGWSWPEPAVAGPGPPPRGRLRGLAPESPQALLRPQSPPAVACGGAGILTRSCPAAFAPPGSLSGQLCARSPASPQVECRDHGRVIRGNSCSGCGVPARWELWPRGSPFCPFSC